MSQTDPRAELAALARSVRMMSEWAIGGTDPGWDVPGVPTPAPAAAAKPVAKPVAKPAPTARAERPTPPRVQAPSGPRTLDQIRAELGDCTRCKLSGLGRSTIVFGEGNPNADLLFAGEGPGFNEDKQGRPFVGPAGELLEKMILAMGLSRERVYICNVVKCHPPNNRDPELDEIAACRPFLEAQVASIKPKVIVTLGPFATQTLLGRQDSMGGMRGQFHDYLGARLMPTYHPAYLLRTPADKGKTWSDLKQVMAELGLQRPGR
ncbi:MAG: uracil-DNA glycosylase family 4 [Myxococcota bacterium]|jgi:uracil-DNA glycosylase family 4